MAQPGHVMLQRRQIGVLCGFRGRGRPPGCVAAADRRQFSVDTYCLERPNEAGPGSGRGPEACVTWREEQEALELRREGTCSAGIALWPPSPFSANGKAARCELKGLHDCHRACARALDDSNARARARYDAGTAAGR